MATPPLFQQYVPFLFRKSRGQEYRAATAEVRKVYGPIEESPVNRYKFLHLTIHELGDTDGRGVRLFSLFWLALVWALLYPFDLKLRTIVGASAYTLTESRHKCLPLMKNRFVTSLCF